MLPTATSHSRVSALYPWLNLEPAEDLVLGQSVNYGMRVVWPSYTERCSLLTNLRIEDNVPNISR